MRHSWFPLDPSGGRVDLFEVAHVCINGEVREVGNREVLSSRFSHIMVSAPGAAETVLLIEKVKEGDLSCG